MKSTVMFVSLCLVVAVGVARCDDPFDPGDSVCGNNKVEPGEQCDREAAAGFDCGTIGMGQGTVLCTDECRWDFSGCTVAPTCGDDVRDAGEACDGSDVGGLQCTDLGFDAGELGCRSDCFFDLATCCRDECDTAGETRCQDDVAEVCVEQESGCLTWGDAVDCAALSPAQVCDATGVGFGCTAPPCVDTCQLEGATRCDATMIQSCGLSAGGCLEWADVVDCGANLPPQECDDGGGFAQCVTPCTDLCTPLGAARCAFGNQVIQTCEVQPSGCRDWSLTEDCSLISSSAFCDDGGSAPVCQACADDCVNVGAMDCFGALIKECVQVTASCSEWQTIQDCSTLTCGYCDNSEGVWCDYNC